VMRRSNARRMAETPATEEQAVERGEQDAADVIGGVVRLQANRENAALAESVAATRDVANFGGGEDEVLVAHEFGCGCGHFRSDGPLERFQVAFGGLIVEKEFAELADGHVAKRGEGVGIVGVENEAGDFVGFGGNQRIVEEIDEREIGEGALGGDAFALGSCGDASELIAGFFLVGFGEKVAETGEVKVFGHGGWP